MRSEATSANEAILCVHHSADEVSDEWCGMFKLPGVDTDYCFVPRLVIFNTDYIWL